ncbi:MAG: HAMP domain-containing sensor histidine kinase [Bacteroidota bacterium]
MKNFFLNSIIYYYLKVFIGVVFFIILLRHDTYAQETVDVQEVIELLKTENESNKDSLTSVLARRIRKGYNIENRNEFLQRLDQQLDSEDLTIKAFGQFLISRVYIESETFYALNALDKGLKWAHEVNDTLLIAWLNLDKGQIHRRHFNFDTAYEIYLNNLFLLSNSRYHYELGYTYQLISGLLYNANLYTSGLDYSDVIYNLKQSLHYYSLVKSSPGFNNALLVDNNNTIGLAFNNSQQTDSALIYFQKAMSLAKKHNITAWEGVLSGNIANLYIKMNQLDTGIALLKTDQRISLEYNQVASAFGATLSLAKAYIRKGDYEKAKLEIDEAELILVPSIRNAQNMRLLLNAYSKYYEALGDWEKAYSYKNMLFTIQDSLAKTYNTLALERAERKYFFIRQSRENDLLKERNELLAKEIKTKNILFIVSLLFILIIIIYTVLLYNQYKIKRKLNNELREKNLKIESHRKELESEVERRTKELVEKNIELDKYLYHSSHDIRGPISTILGLYEVSNLEKSEKELKRLLSLVANCASTMDNMLKKMNDLHNIDKMAEFFHPVDISYTLNDIIESFNSLSKEKGVTINQNNIDNIQVSTNEKLLELAISNLLENAIIFSKTNSESPYTINIEAKTENDNTIISIQDFGEGMKEEVIENIFDVYYRASSKSSGNGLGLFIAKKTINKLGGTLEVNSKFQEGSTFKIILPIIAKE